MSRQWVTLRQSVGIVTLLVLGGAILLHVCVDQIDLVACLTLSCQHTSSMHHRLALSIPGMNAREHWGHANKALSTMTRYDEPVDTTPHTCMLAPSLAW